MSTAESYTAIEQHQTFTYWHNFLFESEHFAKFPSLEKWLKAYKINAHLPYVTDGV
jgi:hypothetical protein